MTGFQTTDGSTDRADPMEETTVTLPDGRTVSIRQLTVKQAVNFGGESDDML